MMSTFTNILIACLFQFYSLGNKSLPIDTFIDQLASLEKIEVEDRGEYLLLKTQEPVNQVYVQLLDRAYTIIYNQTLDITDGTKIPLPQIKPIDRKLTLILKKDSYNVVKKLFDK